MKTKKMAVIGVTAGLVAGAGAGLLLNLPGSVSAARVAVTTDGNSSDNGDDSAPSTAIDGEGSLQPQHHGGPHRSPEEREARLREVLQTLVDAGTIDSSDVDAIVTAMQTEPANEPEDGTPADRVRSHLQALVDGGTLTTAQVDAIIAGLRAARGDHGDDHGDHGDHGGRGRARLEALTTAAQTIGVTVEELRTALQDGQTIAQVATANGVDVQDVIDALVADATANLEQRITDMVNGVRPTPPSDAPDA